MGKGWRTGQDHHNAKLTDREVALLLCLRGEGHTYLALADKFEVPKSTVASICSGRRRSRLGRRLMMG